MAYSSTFPVHPLITWAQTNDRITLGIVMDKLRKTHVMFGRNKFYCHVYDKDDKKIYEITFDLFDNIADSRSKCETSQKIEWTLVKGTPQKWPRLLKTEEKVPWLTVDLNKWDDTFGDDADNSGTEAGDDGEENEDPFQRPMSSATADILDSILIFKDDL